MSAKINVNELDGVGKNDLLALRDKIEMCASDFEDVTYIMEGNLVDVVDVAISALLDKIEEAMKK